jgi:ABC-2 type transport system permease protein
MLAGTAYEVVFLAFAVALVAFLAALVRGALAAAGSALVLLLFAGVAGSATGVSAWVPTGLLGALADRTAGRPATDYLPGLAVTLVLTALALAGAVLLGDRREL